MKRLLPCLHCSAVIYSRAACWALLLGMQESGSRAPLRERTLVQPKSLQGDPDQSPTRFALCCCCHLSGHARSAAQRALRAAAQIGEPASYATPQGLLTFWAAALLLATLPRTLAAQGCWAVIAAQACPSAHARAAEHQTDEAYLCELPLLPDMAHPHGLVMVTA